MLKLKNGANTGSDTLTRDPTRPKLLTRWPMTRFHLWCVVQLHLVIYMEITFSITPLL